MRKLSIILSVAIALSVVILIAPTEVQAQGTRACCEGGFKPNKPCTDDGDCQNICAGGHRDRKPCDNSPCNPACVGGFDDGNNCASNGDADCGTACVGGTRHGKECFNPDPNCPGGTCTNTGTCSNLGTCPESNCTATCLKPGGPKSPDEPASQWQQFQDFLVELEAEKQATKN